MIDVFVSPKDLKGFLRMELDVKEGVHVALHGYNEGKVGIVWRLDDLCFMAHQSQF